MIGKNQRIDTQQICRVATTQYNQNQYYSFALSILVFFSSICISLLIVEPLLVLLSISISACCVFLIYPLWGWLNSSRLSPDQNQALKAIVGPEIARRFRFRVTKNAEAASCNLGFIRWVAVSALDLRIIHEELTTEAMCKLVHELVHTINRDQVRFLSHLFFALSSFVLVLFFFWELYLGEFKGRLFTSNQKEVFTFFAFFYVLLGALSIAGLWTFLHQREFAADSASQELLGEKYEGFLRAKVLSNKFRKPKNTVSKFWNSVTHPSFERRIDQIKSPEIRNVTLLPVAVTQSILIALNIPLIFLYFSAPPTGILTSPKYVTVLYSYFEEIIIGFIFIQCLFSYWAFSEIIRARYPSVLGVFVALGLLLGLYPIESLLMKLVFYGVAEENGWSYAQYQVQEFTEKYSFVRVSVILGLGIFLVALTRLSPALQGRSTLLFALQNLNSAVFALRLCVVLLLAYYGDISSIGKSIVLTLIQWLFVEFCLHVIYQIVNLPKSVKSWRK